MQEVQVEITDIIRIKLSGRIDSSNSDAVKEQLLGQVGDAPGDVVIDASDLEYISSAGLRILLQLLVIGVFSPLTVQPCLNDPVQLFLRFNCFEFCHDNSFPFNRW